MAPQSQMTSDLGQPWPPQPLASNDLLCNTQRSQSSASDLTEQEIRMILERSTPCPEKIYRDIDRTSNALNFYELVRC